MRYSYVIFSLLEQLRSFVSSDSRHGGKQMPGKCTPGSSDTSKLNLVHDVNGYV
jgi:hypothetical protein